jgi:hypothetical protein
MAIVGGADNRILSSQLPTFRESFLQRLLAWVNRLFSFIGLGDAPPLSSDYVQAVRRGKAHVSDPRGIVPPLEDYGAAVSLTPEGYKVTVSASTTSNGNLDGVFDVRVVVNKLQETVLSTACRLGPAHRDRFPDALAHNHRLCIGRLAVIEDLQTKDDYFAIVDRRPYETIHESQYACLLIDLSHEIVRLQLERGLY